MSMRAALKKRAWLKIRRIQAAPTKIFLPVLAAVVLLALTLFWLVLPRVEDHLMERKREMIRTLTEVAWNTARHFADQVDDGGLTLSEAQQQAISQLRDLRYGPDGKDYFWINDMHPHMIMHPYRPDLEGQDVTGFTDPTGKHLFTTFVDTARRQGAGFVDYQWQWQDNANKIVTKISYVKAFVPWGWIIGTGVYVEDVRDQIGAIVHRMALIFAAILMIVALLAGYVVWQGAGVESRRRLMENSLRQSEAKYRLLAETAREIIVMFDNEGHISYANHSWQAISGYGGAELVGQPIGAILPTERQEAFFGKLATIAEGDGHDYFLETELCNSRGEHLPVEATLAQMPGSGYLMMARDVTEKKKAQRQAKLQQEQLFQAAKMASLGTLVSGVAHEINNPITSVLLNIQVFEKFWQGSRPILDDHCVDGGHLCIGGMEYAWLRERLPQLLVHAREGVTRVKQIVGDLKDFAGQRASDARDAIDLNAVAQKAIALVEHMIKKTTDSFQVGLAPGLPTIAGNRQRLEQVVMNLLVNACQALSGKPAGISVTTGFCPEEGSVWLEVRDTGAGMSPAVLERITDPFFTTKRDSGGIGLGLSISDTIVRDHGGRLTFVSHDGQGTTVTMTFRSTDVRSARPCSGKSSALAPGVISGKAE